MDASPLVAALAGAAAGGLAVAALCGAGTGAGLPPRGAPTSGAPVDTAGIFEQGCTAVITGAGSGIGLATAKRCASLGMNVVLADNNKPDLTKAAVAVAEVAQESAGKSGTIVAVPTDGTPI